MNQLVSKYRYFNNDWSILDKYYGGKLEKYY